jgi:hypothetical protein
MHWKIDRWVQSLIDEYTHAVAKPRVERGAETLRTNGDAYATKSLSDRAIDRSDWLNVAKRMFLDSR